MAEPTSWFANCSRYGTEPMMFIRHIDEYYHPCPKCTCGVNTIDVQGLVIAFHEKERYYEVRLDDMTGFVNVKCMKRHFQDDTTSQKRLYRNLRAQLAQPVPELGCCLHVRGRLYQGFEEIEILSSEYSIVSDFRLEIDRLHRICDLYKNVYYKLYAFPNCDGSKQAVVNKRQETNCDFQFYRHVCGVIRRVQSSNHSSNLTGVHLSRLLKELRKTIPDLQEDELGSKLDYLVEKSYLVWVGPYRYCTLT